MKASTREWVDKAEADFVSSGREYRARKQPNYDAACFFAQQCIEKYLKARLAEAGIAFPRTHDLEALLDLIQPAEPLWDSFRPVLLDLTAFAVAFRYPGDSATREMARTAVRHAGRIRDQMRQDMGLCEV
jgi:HEPN domain-containing protein